MFFANYVAVDITSSEIRVIAVQRGKFEKWAAAPLPDGLVKGGIVREPQAMGVIIDNLFRSLRIKKNHVVCTVTGLPFIYRTISMPGTERIPVEAIERESRREMSLGENDMYLTWQVTETHQTSKEVDYFVLGVPKTSLNPLVETLAKAGITKYSIDIKPLALARVAALKDALIVSLEQDNIDVVVVAGGLVRVIHSFNPGDKPKKSIGFVNEIADGLNKAIKAFERDFPDIVLPADTPVLLSGQFSMDDPLVPLVKQAVGREVKMITPALNAPPGMSIGLYATVLGLVSKKITQNHTLRVYQDINLDLLKGLKRLKASRFQLVWVFAAVLSLGLAFMVYESYELKTNAAAEVVLLQQEADTVNRELLEAQKLNQQAVNAKLESEEKSKIADEQLAVVNRNVDMIASQRIDFGSQIAAISAYVPAGAEIMTMDFQSNRIKVTGKALSGFDVLSMVDELEKGPYHFTVKVDQLAPAEDDGIDFQLSVQSMAANSTVVTVSTK